ncbi:MAG: excinuclease ABC subunit UvrC, partial [Actinomycetota bacterium]|nr:excinuclease ABC subunit UvrC [Actinomycetota bacterium]
MADPATYRPAVGSVPEQPGVYRFSDEHGRVIYVGKAKSLRGRLNSYFADVAGLHPRTRTMVLAASKVDWTVVDTEVEALQLEYSWIKEFDPRFNVRYRDDKSYPSLAVTLSEEYPRLQVMRGPKRKGVRYFGPYAHAWAIRETLDLLLRVFPARTCSAGVFKRSAQIGRPCLLGYIGKCAAPCVGRVSADEHRAIVEDFCDFMAGQTSRYTRRLEREMKRASGNQEYERAARLRDDIGALERAMEKNAVVLPDGTDADVVGIAEDSLEAAVQLFHVRGGRVRGQRGWVVDKVEDIATGELVEQFLLQLYGETGTAMIQGRSSRTSKASGRLAETVDVVIPREILVPALPDDGHAVVEWLERLRGSRVDVRVPQRGDKRALLQTVTRNAQQALVLHKTRRASDLTTRSRALEEIQEALDLPAAPLRIECFDVSNLQGTEVVASMVVFEDGLARKSEYRRFVIRGLGDDGRADDTRSIHEVISRRFRRFVEEQEEVGPVEVIDASVADVPSRIDPATGRLKRFAYPPNLVVVDGGAPQVAAARRALDELGIDDVALCGLAKRLEEVWLPGEEDPVILPRTSEGLYLLQRVRDEAHRFAITHHRQRRSKAMTASGLDGIAGLGDVRRKALLRHFGSLKRLREATA